MDHIDSEILLLLQKNARISMSEISNVVNLSVSAVSERLKKLEQSNMIEQYTTILNPSAFNKPLSVFIMLDLDSRTDGNALMSYIQEETDITESHRLAGCCDFLLKVVTSGSEALERILNKLKSFEGIGSVNVSMITSSPKFQPSVSPTE